MADLETIEFLREQAASRRAELEEAKWAKPLTWHSGDQDDLRFMDCMVRFLDRASWECEDAPG